MRQLRMTPPSRIALAIGMGAAIVLVGYIFLAYTVLPEGLSPKNAAALEREHTNAWGRHVLGTGSLALFAAVVSSIIDPRRYFRYALLWSAIIAALSAFGGIAAWEMGELRFPTLAVIGLKSYIIGVLFMFALSIGAAYGIFEDWKRRMLREVSEGEALDLVVEGVDLAKEGVSAVGEHYHWW